MADDLGKRLLDAAPCDWAAMLSEATTEEIDRASSWLGEAATQAAYLCRYTQGLALAQQGMAYGHMNRLRKARSAAKATRRACDYSYPGNHPLLHIDVLEELGERGRGNADTEAH